MLKIVITLTLISTLILSEVFRKQSCQIYDDFFKRCLHYSTTYIDTRNGLKCTQKCEEFDKRHKKCNYESRCEVIRGGFIRTYCKKWNDFFNRCELEDEEFILRERRRDSGDIIINIER